MVAPCGDRDHIRRRAAGRARLAAGAAGSLALLALSLLLGVALSLAAASVGGAIWSRLPGSQDRVFADLMLWGWLRRSVAERRLAQAEKLLGTDPQGASLEALIDLSELLEARDARTYGHSQRVTRHAERIATAMGLPAAEVAKVRTAAALHDIGKLHTPRAILNKPGRLTDSEFALIKRHPVDGAVMTSGIGDPEISAMIRHHHERLDGRGYPDGLSGEDIPVGARIISVADTFDAITSNRTYRRAAHHKRALDVLAAEAGKQLDGDAVAAFRGYYRGHRTVALSALVASAPQRLLTWLGGASPVIGAGAAGATALLIGVGSPQPAVYSPTQPRLPARDHRRRRAEARERRRGLGDARARRHDATSGAGRRGASAAMRAAMARARPGGRSSRLPAAGRPRPGRPRAAVARRTRPRRLPRPATTCRSCPTSRSRRSRSRRCTCRRSRSRRSRSRRSRSRRSSCPASTSPGSRRRRSTPRRSRRRRSTCPASTYPAFRSAFSGSASTRRRTHSYSARRPSRGSWPGAKPSSARARVVSAPVSARRPPRGRGARTSSGRPGEPGEQLERAVEAHPRAAADVVHAAADAASAVGRGAGRGHDVGDEGEVARLAAVAEDRRSASPASDRLGRSVGTPCRGAGAGRRRRSSAARRCRRRGWRGRATHRCSAASLVTP